MENIPHSCDPQQAMPFIIRCQHCGRTKRLQRITAHLPPSGTDIWTCTACRRARRASTFAPLLDRGLIQAMLPADFLARRRAITSTVRAAEDDETLVGDVDAFLIYVASGQARKDWETRLASLREDFEAFLTKHRDDWDHIIIARHQPRD